MKKIIFTILVLTACTWLHAQTVIVTDANGEKHTFVDAQDVVFCQTDSPEPAATDLIKSFTIVNDLSYWSYGDVPTVYTLTWQDGKLTKISDDSDTPETIDYTYSSDGTATFKGSLTSDGEEQMEYILYFSDDNKADYYTWTNRSRNYVFQYDSTKGFTGLLRKRDGADPNPDYGYPKYEYDSNNRIVKLDNGVDHDIITFAYDGATSSQKADYVSVPLVIGHLFNNIDNQWAPVSAMLMGALGKNTGELPTSATIVESSNNTTINLTYDIDSEGKISKINIDGASFSGAPKSISFAY